MAGTKGQSIADELGVEDLYKFLSVEPDATQKEITSAYRRKARKCHPDKNPDDPKAAELFQKLSNALSILLDPAGKAAYDKWLKARHSAQRRHLELSTKRRKLKEELELRESQHVSNAAAEVAATTQMQKEIERLREEGLRIMKEQEEKLRQEFLTKTSVEEEEDEDITPTLKVTWKAKRSDDTNGGYSQGALEAIFSEFGPLHHVLVSSKRKGKALVAFYHPFDAQRAVEGVRGLPDNPMTVAWLSGKPSGGGSGVTSGGGARGVTGDVGSDGVRGDSVGGEAVKGDGVAGVGIRDSGDNGGLVRETDYESVTLMRLRQVEERKRLSQQLAGQETDTQR